MKTTQLEEYFKESILSKQVWFGEIEQFYKFQFDASNHLKIQEIYIRDYDQVKQYQSNIEAEVFEYFNKETAERIYAFYYTYKGREDSVEVIYSDNRLDRYWVYAKFIKDSMMISLNKINREEKEFSSYNQEKNTVIPCDYSLYVRLEKESPLTLIRYSKSVLEIFEVEEKDIEEMIQGLIALLYQGVFYSQLQKYNRAVLKYTLNTKNKSVPCYLEIQCKKAEDTQYLFIKGYRLDGEAGKTRIKNFANQHWHLYKSDYFGMCDLKVEDGEITEVLEINNHLKELLKMNELEIQKLCRHSILKEVIRNRTMKNRDIYLVTKEKRKRRFKLCMIPEYQNGVLIILHIALFEEENKDILARMNALTKREKEILVLVIRGETNRFIAEHLKITEGTVKKTVHRAYKKLDICSRLELLEIYKRHWS